jgi:hypothetical protein
MCLVNAFYYECGHAERHEMESACDQHMLWQQCFLSIQVVQNPEFCDACGRADEAYQDETDRDQVQGKGMRKYRQWLRTRLVAQKAKVQFLWHHLRCRSAKIS